MTFASRAPFSRSLSLLLIASLGAILPAFAHDFTGMSHDDAKELMAPTQITQAPPVLPPSSYDAGFLPMPAWARGVVMPSLPDALKPMGRKLAVLTTPPVAAPAPLAPPTDSSSPTVIVSKPKVVTPGPAAAPQNPALIAVSPFLDWIKANPQAAAEQARQQASVYQAAAEANGAGATPGVGVNPNTPSGPIVTTPTPYWMPPLIDSAPFGAGGSGSSAAIYSTPQR